MVLQSINIRKLFGQFDYTISLNQKGGITILTGPNGYGKTTILNIIYNFFKQNFFFFKKLNFEMITFYFSEDKSVIVTKKVDFAKRANEVNFELKLSNKTIESYVFNNNIEKELLQKIIMLQPSMQRELNNESFKLEEALLQIQKNIFDLLPENNEQINQLISMFSSVNVHLIKEQRLIKFDNNLSYSHTIQEYANNLSHLIRQKQAEAFKESQKLDNSFPNRLMQASNSLSEEEFNAKFENLRKKQHQLKQFGIAISDIQLPEYNKDKSDVISVYLEDSEKKTGFFDDLVKKIELFVNIIEEKKFAHKKINIDGDLGFYFTTDNGQLLDLTALSSGEQEEVVVLYELLFKTEPNALILVDEPEISLHVSWQKTFIKDLLSISAIQPISFIIATHSPQIVNGNWDLTTDLYELDKKQECPENE